ncbi:winged helix-turn-helix transcriptional regulator [Yangia mangrovi]|uniref:Winged helix-turn-helix transcriptional regulator n=1 Tax=Alloyangia mangrovi TaxID=1779329 RepID=A0A2A3JXT9_9RHOB|nr:MarR family winged helix-turn-helix transcriptional regulator [Alloyangia mangrovi]MCT4371837.1 winged helix-turn-helix transcriptional regulator [Alloyangia mangrovi]
MTNATKRDSARIAARQAREDHNLFSRLPAIYAASRSQGQQFLQRGGELSIVEWRTLWDLHEVGPMTIRDLAATQRADHSLLSRALPEMRRKGYVTMRRDEDDGRQTIVEIAPAGRAAYHRAAPVMARRRAALREVFSEEEIGVFVGYLDRLESFLRRPVDEVLKEESAK